MTERPSNEAIEVKVNGWRILLRVRTLAYLLAAMGVGGGATAMARLVGVATTEDVKVLADKATEVQAKIEPRVTVLEQTVASQATAVQSVQDTQSYLVRYTSEDIADRLADRAADPIKDAKRARKVADVVRAKALSNLAARKPAREGLESYLE
jgi:hypothetical protein